MVRRQLPRRVSEIVQAEVVEIVAGRKRPRRGRGSMSWVGFEQEKERLIQLAHEYYQADAQLHNTNRDQTIEITLRAYNDPYAVNVGRDVGIVLRELMPCIVIL